jgi:hypothetical protein
VAGEETTAQIVQIELSAASEVTKSRERPKATAPWINQARSLQATKSHAATDQEMPEAARAQLKVSVPQTHVAKTLKRAPMRKATATQNAAQTLGATSPTKRAHLGVNAVSAAIHVAREGTAEDLIVQPRQTTLSTPTPMPTTTVLLQRANHMLNTATLSAATQALNPPTHRARTEKDADVTVTAETVERERQETMKLHPSTKDRPMSPVHRRKMLPTTGPQRFVKVLILMRHKAHQKPRQI